MSDTALPPASAEAQVLGRSLWADARSRLTRNKAAVASLVALGLIALGCLIGPAFTGHPFDRVYQDYVRTPASLASYPQPDQIRPAADRIAARTRTRAEAVTVEATSSA
jgi:oligopeptide transport system permease protein